MFRGRNRGRLLFNPILQRSFTALPDDIAVGQYGDFIAISRHGTYTRAIKIEEVRMHGKVERKLRRHRAGRFLVLLLICFAFAAEAADQQALIDGARKDGKLVVYSLLAVPDHSQIVKRFEPQYPFVEVSLIRPGSSEWITARVITEARAGRNQVDIIGVSRLNMHHLIQKELVMSYESPERQYFDPHFKDKNGHWTAFYVNPAVMACNSEMVPSAKAPKNYQDLDVR